eukprot:1989856-Amphidinium_carterae.1
MPVVVEPAGEGIASCNTMMSFDMMKSSMSGCTNSPLGQDLLPASCKHAKGNHPWHRCDLQATHAK